MEDKEREFYITAIMKLMEYNVALIGRLSTMSPATPIPSPFPMPTPPVPTTSFSIPQDFTRLISPEDINKIMKSMFGGKMFGATTDTDEDEKLK